MTIVGQPSRLGFPYSKIATRLDYRRTGSTAPACRGR